MMQISEYFNRFYNIVIKQLIKDPIVHSQWVYFVSMFKNSQLDKGRIQLYLNILNSQHKHKYQVRSVQTKTNTVSSSQNKNQVFSSNDQDIPAIELKFNHKLSEKWKGNIDSFQKSASQSVQLRKLSSQQESSKVNRPPLYSEPKAIKTRKQSYTYALPTTIEPSICSTPSGITFPPNPSKQKRQSFLPKKNDKNQKENEKYSKLCEISNRIMNIFTKNTNLRA